MRNMLWCVKGGMPSILFCEAIIGLLCFDRPSNLFQPTYSTAFRVVEFRDIGFDVQKGRSIENVHVLNIQGPPPDLDKSDDGKPDRIGPLRCSCGKKASRFGIQERGNDEFIAAALMEVVKKNQMGETIKILQPICKFRKEFHSAADSCRARRLDGHVLQFLERRVNDADGTT